MAAAQPSKTAKPRPPEPTRPIVRAYTIVALAALVGMSILLVDSFDFWCIVPLLIGALGVVWKWTNAPAVLVCLLVMLLAKGNHSLPPGWEQPVQPVLLVLLPLVTFAYVVASTRLLSLVRHTVPPDTRRARRPAGRRMRGRWLLPREATTRSAATLPAGEIGLLLSMAPMFLAAAYMIWGLLVNTEVPDWFEGPRPLWRVLVLTWGAVIVLASSWAFLAHRGRLQATTEESLLFLQDQLWTATRGEQRQINRAIARARLRQQRKEEGA